jgi:hypothetical protein
MRKILFVISLVLGLVAFGAAQTTPVFTANTEAVAFHYNNAWNVGTHVSESFDFYDTASKNLHVYVVGHEYLPGDGTFGSYLGGAHVDYNPAKWLAKTNVPANTLLIGGDVAIGETTFTAGNKFTTYVGGTFKYNFSNAVSGSILNAGVLMGNGFKYPVISTGLIFKIGSK